MTDINIKLPKHKTYTLKDTPAYANYVHGYNSAINEIKRLNEKLASKSIRKHKTNR